MKTAEHISVRNSAKPVFIFVFFFSTLFANNKGNKINHVFTFGMH